MNKKERKILADWLEARDRLAEHTDCADCRREFGAARAQLLDMARAAKAQMKRRKRDHRRTHERRSR